MVSQHSDPDRTPSEMRVANGDVSVNLSVADASANNDVPLKRRYPDTEKHFINQDEFDELFNYLPEPKIDEKAKKFGRKVFHPCTSFSNFQRFILSFFPVLNWLRNYDVKSDLLGDMMAGITVGIVQVPQGIAYAILTGVDPVYGLYSSFFGVILYMIFGTSNHVSIGSFAIISLMTGVSSDEILESIHREHVGDEIKYLDQMHRLGNADTQVNFKNLTALVPQAVMADKLGVVATLTFCAGLIQLLMALLRIEFLASYLSDQLVAGFSTGAAVQIVVVQLDKLFQVKMERFDGPGRVIRQLIDVCYNIAETNQAAAIISLCSFMFLYIGKDRINPWIKKKIPVPLPFELLLVIITTTVSYFVNMQDTYGVKVVNEVPTGLPKAFLPRFHLIRYCLWDSVEIAFVIVAIHLSMCKIFNRKHGYKTDNNQELYALGFVATLSSLFNTYPVSSALGRSILNEECGARTQLSAAFTALLLLVVILFVGPLLAALPMCVLAAIIIYSMKSIFYSFKEVTKLWKIARIDCAIWIVSFLATTFFNVMEGLAISVVFALMTTIFRIQWPRFRMLARLSSIEDYRDIGRYGRVSNMESIRVLRFDAPLLFANVEHFRDSVEKAVVDCSIPTLATLDNMLCTEYEETKNDPKSPRRDTKQLLLNGTNISDFEINSTAQSRTVEHLVIDCSGFTFVDYTSIKALQEVFVQMVSTGTRIYFAGAKAPVRDMFEACGLYKSVPRDNFYPTIYDAVEAAIARKKRRAERKKKAAAAYENNITPPEKHKKNKRSVEDSKTGNAHVRIVVDDDGDTSSD